MQEKNKKKIKIAFFSTNSHTNIGGIESYTRLLIKLLDPKIYDISEFYYLNQDGNYLVSENILGEKSFLVVKKRKKWKGKLNFLNYVYANHFCKKWKKHKLDDFDVIIDHNPWNHPMINHKIKNKTVHVQHFYNQFYKMSFFATSKIGKSFMDFLENFYPMFSKWKKCQNYVVYDAENEKTFNFNYDFQKATQIAIAFNGKIKKPSEMDFDAKKEIIFIGRIENQKNIVFLDKVAKLLDKPLHLYGSGSNVYLNTLIDNNYNIIKKGVFNNDKISDIHKNSYVLLMTSDYEGFPIVVVEALSNGVPIILRDTYPSAKFLVDNGKNGILVPSQATEEEYAKVVNDFLNLPKEEYKKIVKNCLDFAEKNLSIQTFERKWKKVINDVVEKNKNK